MDDASLRDRAVVNGAGQAVSAVPASIPSADEIRQVADLFDPAYFEPALERVVGDVYERLLTTCQGYLKENIEHNIGSHIAMLERENRRMRTELYEVDRALGCVSLGQNSRLGAIKEAQDRYDQASAEVWRLRAELAQGGVTRMGGDGEAGSGPEGTSTRSEGCAQ